MVVAVGLWSVPHLAMASEVASPQASSLQASSSQVTSPEPASAVVPALPQPLSDFDVQQYQRLFHLQEMGRMKQATREMGRLDNTLLKGHLLSQRYWLLQLLHLRLEQMTGCPPRRAGGVVAASQQ